jgi:hypothetical protein
MAPQHQYSWQAPCLAALQESDPRRLLGRIDCALTALARRSAEWSESPGQQAERKAIRRAIAALKKRLSSYEATKSASAVAGSG